MNRKRNWFLAAGLVTLGVIAAVLYLASRPALGVYDQECRTAWQAMSPQQKHGENRAAFMDRCLAHDYAAQCADGYIDVGDAQTCKAHGGDKFYLRFPDG